MNQLEQCSIRTVVNNGVKPVVDLLVEEFRASVAELPPFELPDYILAALEAREKGGRNE